MKVFRQGAIKLINSLSRSSDVVRLETIDPDETILRINLDDLGWDAEDWDTVLAVYPYNLQPDSDLKSVLSGATGTQLPYVRADWFAFAASQPPLYDKLLKLPEHLPGTGEGAKASTSKATSSGSSRSVRASSCPASARTTA